MVVMSSTIITSMSVQKLLHNAVMAMLREQLESPDMMPFVLPALLAMVEHSSNEDYRKLVQPELRKVISGTRPVQVSVERRMIDSSIVHAAHLYHLYIRSFMSGMACQCADWRC